MKSDWRGVLMSKVDDEVVYDLYCYRGHIFRVYPDGHIGAANDEDRAFAAR